MTFMPCSAADLRRGQGVEALQEFFHPHSDILPLAAKGHEFPFARLGLLVVFPGFGFEPFNLLPQASFSAWCCLKSSKAFRTLSSSFCSCSSVSLKRSPCSGMWATLPAARAPHAPEGNCSASQPHAQGFEGGPQAFAEEGNFLARQGMRGALKGHPQEKAVVTRRY